MKTKIFFILLCTLLIVNTPINILANNTTIDSKGSINENDDSINNGVDITQGKETNYSAEIEEESKEDTFVYVSQSSTFSVIIPKTIILDGITKNANYEVIVKGNIGGEETINVVPDENFLMKQEGKNDIVSTISQDKTSWKYKEFETKGNGYIIANDMTAGSWNGHFTFFIELSTTPYIDINAIDTNGNDLNANAIFIMGQDKTQLINKLVENGYIETTNDVISLINVETNSFENTAKTTIDVSAFAKPNDIIAIYHYNKNTNEWKYISTCVVDENNEISANFSSFSPIAFVKTNCYKHIDEDGNGLCDTCKYQGTITYVYHKHSSTCYQKQTQTSRVNCSGYSGGHWQHNGAWYATCTTCSHCWAVGGSGSWSKCPAQRTTTYTVDVKICNKDETTIESQYTNFE